MRKKGEKRGGEKKAQMDEVVGRQADEEGSGRCRCR